MAWQFRGHSPVYRQIVRHIRADILNGRYQPDEQIPPVRQLAMEASVNPNTMQRALQELEARGLLNTQRTAGRTVTEDKTMIAQLREQLAAEQIGAFLQMMEKLGYTRAQTLALLQQKAQEE